MTRLIARWFRSILSHRCEIYSNTVEWMDWPDVMHGDIFNYLILTPEYTFEQLKTLLRYKAGEGFEYDGLIILFKSAY